jgi:23S rRNA (cytidine2498-2'-O)-methyltransferase
MLLFHCRSGFEADCAAEITAHAHAAHASGHAEHRSGAAHVLWLGADAGGRRRSVWQPAFHELVFPRQMLAQCVRIELPGAASRCPAIVEAAKRFGKRFGAVWLEAPDADKPRQRLAGLRQLENPLREALLEARLLRDDGRGERLHVCFLERDEAILGTSKPGESAPWPLEALAVFIPEHELSGRMRAGRVAIDLGAAPGGWSQALASRGLRVVAVDNGPIAQAVLDTQLVEHRREDAFRFRPDLPVDWMVCDVVAAPARIAALASQWIARGWCRETIFNLKLPNRERWQEVLRCQQVVERALARVEGSHALRIKHLYHDREEVTAHLRRL